MKRTILLSAVAGAMGMVISAASAATPGPAEAGTPAKGTSKISDLFPDVVVARGKGIEIKRSELDNAMVSIKSNLAARGQDLPPDEMNHLEQQILDRLIQVQVLLHRANADDKAAGKESSVKRLDAIKARVGSDDALNRQLKSMGTSAEEMQAKMAEES